jgi:hypothetical protein
MGNIVTRVTPSDLAVTQAPADVLQVAVAFPFILE